MPRAAVLYDRDCGFCRWSAARILRRDAHRVLLPVAIQSDEGRSLLTGMPEEKQLESWHLVMSDGRVLSGGAAAPELLSLLGLRVRARLLLTAPRTTDRLYRAVASRRRFFGRVLVTNGAKDRADRLIADRSPPPFASPVEPASCANDGEHVPRVGTESPTFAAPPEPRELTAARAAQPSEPETLQQRIESSDFGRGLISAILVATLVGIVAINLPDSTIRRKIMRPGQPYLNALGLDQNWALFAPDPRRAVIDFDAVVRYDDGSTATWHFPENDAVVGAYRDYRWRKWAENVLAPANATVLWHPAASWAAARMLRPGRRELTVTLVSRIATLNPPGVTPSQGPWHTRSLYTLPVHQ